jgi:hypothetical protein
VRYPLPIGARDPVHVSSVSCGRQSTVKVRREKNVNAHKRVLAGSLPPVLGSPSTTWG